MRFPFALSLFLWSTPRPRMPPSEQRDRKRHRESSSPEQGTLDSSAILPVEVMAHSLRWSTLRQLLRTRKVNQKWFSAVCLLMEDYLDARMCLDGEWEVPLRSLPRRLVLVSSPFFAPDILQNVLEVDLGDMWCRDHRCETALERELTLIADNFPRLKRLRCPQTITDTGLREVVLRAEKKKFWGFG
jgi:hypothetical protein